MKALAASGADPSRLMLEAPESAFNENPDAAVAILQRLADWQVRVAIDDFGSSLAPLNHLVHLPVGMVKLAPQAHGRRALIGPPAGRAGVADSPRQHAGLADRRPGNRDSAAARGALSHGMRFGPGSSAFAASGTGTSARACRSRLLGCRAGNLSFSSGSQFTRPFFLRMISGVA